MPEISPSLYRAGEGEPLVLLHGFTGTWHHWRPVLAELVPRFEVIAPTLAGHDGGPPLELSGSLTIATGADSLERHLDELGIETAHFAGNSMGGAFAIELAARGRARSVVALSPGGGWLLDSREPQRVARFFAKQMRLLRRTQTQLARATRFPSVRRLALRDVMRHGELVSPADAVQLSRSALKCTIADQVIDALRHGGAELVPTQLDRVAVPVLLAWAQFDRVLPLSTCSARFRAEIPGAEFRVLPAVGHLPTWDNAALVTDTIVGWISRHAAVSAAA
jgi:pimeloyl-ACP methyl ester carboxylesterase